MLQLLVPRPTLVGTRELAPPKVGAGHRNVRNRMVLRMLFARCVGRYLPTLSFGLVVVVHLLFGAMPSIRNIVAQKLVKDCCRNFEREL
jgi:hypothetical protein